MLALSISGGWRHWLFLLAGDKELLAGLEQDE